MLTGFKDFILRGNVVDLAVAVVIGAAFAAVVTGFVDHVINPLLAALGGSDSVGLGVQLVNGNPDAFLDLGKLIGVLITFVLTAAVVYFLIVVPMNTIKARRRSGEEAGPAEPTDVELLIEIRDLLARQGGPSR